MQPTRSVRPFEVISDYEPSGDQPQAISELASRINAGETDIVLLGATGTGKSATTVRVSCVGSVSKDLIVIVGPSVPPPRTKHLTLASGRRSECFDATPTVRAGQELSVVK